MHAAEISPGMVVRYPRTGTTGVVQRIETIRGTAYAELDSTHLLYLVEHLIPAEMSGRRVHASPIEDAKKTISKEREYASGLEFQEVLRDIDHSCEGGG